MNHNQSSLPQPRKDWPAPTKPTTVSTTPLRLQRRFTPPPVLDQVTPPANGLIKVPSMGMGRAW